jgi:Protein of unknown function (DUF998)
VISGPLFVATFLVEGAARANYDALRHPVSSLELGPSGWMQSANFLVAGLLTLAFFVFCRRFAAWGERAWAVYSALTGVVFTVAFVLASVGFGQAESLVGLAGLFQRIAVAAGFGWLTLLAIHSLSDGHAESGSPR